MKIILINPPFEEWLTIAKDKRRKAILEIVAPLGLAYLAAVLERNNYQVKIYDSTIGISQSELLNSLTIDNPDIVGITATSVSFASAEKIAENVRKFLSKAIIVIGGPHVTALPQETMSFECFDVGVIGEGEITFLELVKQIEQSGLRQIEYIDGIIYRKDGGLILNKKRSYIKNLDEIPFPARHLLPPLSVYSPSPVSYKHLPIAAIMSSRGCTMRCVFCDKAVFGSNYRTRSSDNILEEIELLKNKFGAKEISFFDDNFTLDQERIFELCYKIRKRKIKIPWSCLTSTNCVSKELLREMKQAGCWQIWFGLESGDEGILKQLRKDITLAQNEMAVKWAKEEGLNVRATFAVGSPWETKESLQRTLDFAKKIKIDYAHFIKCTPFPGSELYKILIKKGYNFDFTKNYEMLNPDTIIYVPESLTKEEFTNFLRRARKNFYLRFSYILRRLVSIRTWNDLRRHILSFFTIKNFN